MNFTFQKYKKSLIPQYLLLIICIISFSILIIFHFKNNINKFIILLIINIYLIITIKKLLNRYISINQFLNNNSKEKLKQLEKELNKSLIIYNNWFLTEKYIFVLSNQEFIEYNEIVSIKSSTKIRLWYRNILHMISYQAKIILKNKKSYTFEVSYEDKQFIDEFINIIKHRNFDLLVNQKQTIDK